MNASYGRSLTGIFGDKHNAGNPAAVDNRSVYGSLIQFKELSYLRTVNEIDGIQEDIGAQLSAGGAVLAPRDQPQENRGEEKKDGAGSNPIVVLPTGNPSEQISNGLKHRLQVMWAAAIVGIVLIATAIWIHRQ